MQMQLQIQIQVLVIVGDDRVLRVLYLTPLPTATGDISVLFVMFMLVHLCILYDWNLPVADAMERYSCTSATGLKFCVFNMFSDTGLHVFYSFWLLRFIHNWTCFIPSTLRSGRLSRAETINVLESNLAGKMLQLAEHVPLHQNGNNNGGNEVSICWYVFTRLNNVLKCWCAAEISRCICMCHVGIRTTNLNKTDIKYH